LAIWLSYRAKLDRTRSAAVVLGALACLLGVALAPVAPSTGVLAIHAPWCLATGPSANAAGYLVIDNRGYTPDRLTAITSPAARRVSIHQSRVNGGLATMTLLASIELPARTVVTFAPGGLHLMLEALRRPLTVGERVPVTLWFKVSGPVRTSLVVMLRPPVAAPSPTMRM
jgi:copper(I)-binding protein